MLEARDAGWLPAGVDANATAREAVRAEGMECEASLEDLELEPQSVGAVTFFQSLEHLPNPMSALTEARELLAPDGSVLVETWDRSSRTARISGSHWQQLSPPSVLWLLDESSLSRLAETAGLRLESWRWSTKWVTLGLVTGQLAEPGSGLGKTLGRARSLPLPYFLGDLVTARLRLA
jgi:SAM-dependent methyltransferase